MKKLSIILAVILALLAGCVQILPEITPETAAPEPSATVSVQAAPSPTETATLEPVASVVPTVTPTPEPAPALPEVNDRELSYENEHIEVDIHCPEISGLLDESFQQDVNDTAYNSLKDRAAEIEQAAIEDTMPASTYYINSAFRVRRNDGTFLSIRQSVEYFSGGANIGSELKFINIMNTESGQRLALYDLFQPGTDYTTLISKRIRNIIAANPDMSDFTFTEISGDQAFYLTDSALVIAFQNYDIAPGAYGPQEFSIPLADISDDLIPELS